MTAQYYSTSLDHILAELERIDLLIQSQVYRARHNHQTDSEFQGLYITESEIDALLTQPAGLPHWSGVDAEPSEYGAGLEKITADIENKKAQSITSGVKLRLCELEKTFQLNTFDKDTILICLAPEIDLRYERMFAYLHDDVTKKRPSVDLVLNLLTGSLMQKVECRQRFLPDSPLLANQLISLFEDPSNQPPPFQGKYLKLDDQIANYLLGAQGMDDRVSDCGEIITPRKQLDNVILSHGIKSHLIQLLQSRDINTHKLIFYFQGVYGVGRQITAEAVCKQLGKYLLKVNTSLLLKLSDNDFEHTINLLNREASLHAAALYWKDFDSLLAEDHRFKLENFNRAVNEQNDLTFLVGNSAFEPTDAFHDKHFIRIEFPIPEYQQRIELWADALKTEPNVDDLEINAVASKFRFGGGQIRDTAETARNIALWRDPEKRELTMEDLYRACRLQSNRSLEKLAQKITPRYKWDDIVLPTKRKQQLREVYNAARYSPLIYSEWGFGEKLSLGKGLSVLFAGPSGTGKTMAAEIIAGELGLDMYKIDLSIVVSKYIGETEKNLARIFAEAETANAILFFDEADALFGKRSEVRDSHDRYANIETGYLLQRIEEYEGVVILASNLSKHMDEAFVRRMHFNIEFPFPKDKDRVRIWRGVWPDKTPLSKDLDLEFMANRFELAGGNIKNIALASAFLAADDGGVVNMNHLISATQREYEKMGRVIMEGEFGKYNRVETV